MHAPNCVLGIHSSGELGAAASAPVHLPATPEAGSFWGRAVGGLAKGKWAEQKG